MTTLKPASVFVFSFVLLLQFLQHSVSVSSNQLVRVFVLLNNDKDFKNSYSKIFQEVADGSTPILMRYKDNSWKYVQYNGGKIQKMNDGSEKKRLQNLITIPGRKIVYITGQLKEINTQYLFEKDITPKHLANITCSLFPINSDQIIVTTVFNENLLQTYMGHEFIQLFEEEAKQLGVQMGIGLTEVNLYLGLNQKDKKELEEWDLTAFSYVTVQFESVMTFLSPKTNSWIPPTSPENEFQQKIREAEHVKVFIYSETSSNSNGFRVGGNSEDDLAKKLIDIFKGREHPYQRVELNFPQIYINDPVGTAYIRAVIEKMRNANIFAYGKQPRITLHLIVNSDDLFQSDLLIKFFLQKLKNTTNIPAIYTEGQWSFFNYRIDKGIDWDIEDIPRDSVQSIISSAEELNIEINGHGCFSNGEFLLPGLNASALSLIIRELFSNLPSNKRVEVGFYVCNAGTTKGQEYINTFLKISKANKFVIDEVIAFNGTTQQHNIFGTPFAVDAPLRLPPKISLITRLKFFLSKKIHNLYKKYAIEPQSTSYFALKDRLTIRTTRDNNGYIHFPILPAEEHRIYMIKKTLIKP